MNSYNHQRTNIKKLFRLLISILLTFVILIGFTPSALAFCGFYVAKADSKLYNKASQIVIARKDNRTLLTMANDYQGNVKDFAMVVPVPTVLEEEQVQVGKPNIIERLDAFSAPRLVEYFDEDPCAPVMYDRALESAAPPPAPAPLARKRSNRDLGVTVEAQFNVGEYDIVILSAKESRGLERWLRGNGYKIPRGAKRLLNPYIRQKMKFFVAKVNLEKFDENGYQKLRPLQISYESNKFMLPIRLGMVNSTSEQDLIAYILSPKGQAELTNYRTAKIPSNVNVPIYVKQEFGDFYKSMFQTSYIKEDKKVAFLEYAWDMSNCDPCSADPLSREELKDAGVFWLDNTSDEIAPPGFPSRRPRSSNVFITRLHVRYTRDKFPEDLMFQETSNRKNFQGRYVLQHPYTGKTNCKAGRQYKKSLRKRFEKEAQTLARLTNWNIQDIRQKMKLEEQASGSFWQGILSWFGM